MAIEQVWPSPLFFGVGPRHNSNIRERRTMAMKPRNAETPKYKLNEDQLKEQLLDDIAELRREAEAYDGGDFSAAGAMAVRVMTLLYDSGKTVSRTTRLGCKPEKLPQLVLNGLKQVAHTHGPYCQMAVNLIGTTGYLPNLDMSSGDQALDPIEFKKWWDAPVLRDAVGNMFTRGDIVRTMRDCETAHADGSLPEAYGAVLYEGMFSIRQHAPEEQIGDLRIIRVIMRQIAHEVLRALDGDHPLRPFDNRGRFISPTLTIEVFERYADGSVGQRVDDARAVPVVVHLTTDTKLAARWDDGSEPCELPAGLPEMPDHCTTRLETMMRAVILNYNHTPVVINQMRVGRDRRSGAFVLRCVVSVDSN